MTDYPLQITDFWKKKEEEEEKLVFARLTAKLKVNLVNLYVTPLLW